MLSFVLPSPLSWVSPHCHSFSVGTLDLSQTEVIGKIGKSVGENSPSAAYLLNQIYLASPPPFSSIPELLGVVFHSYWLLMSST